MIKYSLTMAKTTAHKRKKKASVKAKSKPAVSKPIHQEVANEVQLVEQADLKTERTWVDAIIIFVFVGLALVVAFMATNNNDGYQLDDNQKSGGDSQGIGIGVDSDSDLGQLGQSSGASPGQTQGDSSSNPQNPAGYNQGSSGEFQNTVDKCSYQQFEQSPLSPECINR